MKEFDFFFKLVNSLHFAYYGNSGGGTLLTRNDIAIRNHVEVYFAVVLLTVNSQFRIRDIEGFYENSSPPRHTDKKKQSVGKQLKRTLKNYDRNHDSKHFTFDSCWQG